MYNNILQGIKNELVNGSSKKEHPYRFFTIGTQNGNTVRLRTVVLRKVFPNFKLLFYTDKRSQKVADIKKQKKISILFYHPKKKLQLRMDGEANIISDTVKIEELWKNISAASRKDYTTLKAPGEHIKAPEHLEFDASVNHFCPIEIEPQQIEFLRLGKPHHTRISYHLVENEWKGQFLVP